MVYGAGTIKRKRRTQAEVEQLDNQIMDALRSDNPASVRHTFYMMTDPRLPEPVEKSDRGYRHVQHRVKVLREAGRLPYHWITDATRRGYHVSTFDGAEDFMRRMAGLYRADLWVQSEWYVEVWCESRSIAGVIQDTCEELAVSLYPAGGFTSMTLAYQAARYINAKGRNRSVAVLYIGDYDPAGVLIDKQVESELRKHLRADVDLHFHRVGITEDQIAVFDLPTKPRKETDRRAAHIKHTVEAEAMPAKLMRSILRESIEAYLPPGALEVAKVAEESERALLLNWGSS